MYEATETGPVVYSTVSINNIWKAIECTSIA